MLGHSVTESEEGVVRGLGPEFVGTGVGLLGNRGTTLLGDRGWVIRGRLLDHG